LKQKFENGKLIIESDTPKEILNLKRKELKSMSKKANSFSKKELEELIVLMSKELDIEII
jgi:hypothetical protein